MNDEVERDRYGPLNRYNANRSNAYNPGNANSDYNSDGTRRQQAEIQEVDEDPALAAFREHLFNMRDTPERAPRQRHYSVDDACLNKTCPITLSKIKGHGIQLSDGKCYDANAIVNWYRANQTNTPFRKEYTEDDIQKITDWSAFIRGNRTLRRRRTPTLTRRRTLRSRRTPTLRSRSRSRGGRRRTQRISKCMK